MEHVPQPLQRAAHGRLAEHKPFRSARDIPFFGKRRKDDQQVEVRLA